jgi:hypothetical protein
MRGLGTLMKTAPSRSRLRLTRRNSNQSRDRKGAVAEFRVRVSCR